MSDTTSLRDALLAKVTSDWDMDPWGEHEAARARLAADLDAYADAVRQAERDLLMPQFDASVKALSSALDEANAEARAGLVSVEALREAMVKVGLTPKYGYKGTDPAADILAALAPPPAVAPEVEPDGR